MDRLIPAVVVLIAGLLAHRAHRQVDQIRFSDDRTERIFLPSAQALKVASMGYQTITADLMWVRSVLTFAEIYEAASDEDVQWLDAMLTSVATLDPRWRTVYFHGGGMLRVCDAIDESDALFARGMEALPEEPYFPFSIAMNAYLYRSDRERAAEYLDLAAKIPGAPPWYGSAAAGILEDGGGRKAAIRYLREQLAATSEPAVIRSLNRKLSALLHDELAEQIAEHRSGFVERFGRDIMAIEELGELPPDPHGAQWILGADGVIRSEVEEAKLAREAQLDERWMVTVPWGRFE